jgi:23S rRNA (uracil1939-C5)-methyltransferase
MKTNKNQLPLNLNDILEVKTEGMSFGSAAVARLKTNEGNHVIFVYGAAPNEYVRIKITNKKKNYFESIVLEVLEKSPFRVTPFCPYFGFSEGHCGGCDWQHIDYKKQVLEKTHNVLYQIARTLKIDLDTLNKITKSYPAKSPFFYRNRIQLRGDQNKIGFYERGSQKIISIDECKVAHPKLNEKLKEFISKNRFTEIKYHEDRFKIEWTFDLKSNQVLEAINKPHAALGFTQINHEQNEVMINIIKNIIQNLNFSKSNSILLDLYGGSGNLSKPMLSFFDELLCVDLFNNGIQVKKDASILTPPFSLIRADIEKFLKFNYLKPLVFDRKKNLACIIADPPREGLVKTSHLIRDLNVENIILVSCDPTTLARDLSRFQSKYEIKSIHIIDMFPQTHHCESVIHLNLFKSMA